MLFSDARASTNAGLDRGGVAGLASRQQGGRPRVQAVVAATAEARALVFVHARARLRGRRRRASRTCIQRLRVSRPKSQETRLSPAAGPRRVVGLAVAVTAGRKPCYFRNAGTQKVQPRDRSAVLHISEAGLRSPRRLGPATRGRQVRRDRLPAVSVLASTCRNGTEVASTRARNCPWVTKAATISTPNCRGPQAESDKPGHDGPVPPGRRDRASRRIQGPQSAAQNLGLGHARRDGDGTGVSSPGGSVRHAAQCREHAIGEARI